MVSPGIKAKFLLPKNKTCLGCTANFLWAPINEVALSGKLLLFKLIHHIYQLFHAFFRMGWKIGNADMRCLERAIPATHHHSL